MFKVGDTVIVLTSEDNAIPKKAIGKIVSTSGSLDRNISVSFKIKYSGAHSLNGKVVWGHGYYFYEKELKLVKDIHICGLICKCDAKEAITF